jgi:AbrB family looped-hinge helix DNA binding protein
MIMKVFNKGQVVIPVEIRRTFDIHPGDNLEVEIDQEHHVISLRKPHVTKSQSLAGALSSYAGKKTFPTSRQMKDALAEGLSHA